MSSFLRTGCSVIALQFAVLALTPASLEAMNWEKFDRAAGIDPDVSRSVRGAGSATRSSQVLRDVQADKDAVSTVAAAVGLDPARTLELSTSLRGLGLDPKNNLSTRAATELMHAGLEGQKLTATNISFLQANPGVAHEVAKIGQVGLDPSLVLVTAVRAILATPIAIPSKTQIETTDFLLRGPGGGGGVIIGAPSEAQINATVALRKAQIPDATIDQAAITLMAGAITAGIAIPDPATFADYEAAALLTGGIPPTQPEFDAFVAAQTLLGHAPVQPEFDAFVAAQTLLGHALVQPEFDAFVAAQTLLGHAPTQLEFNAYVAAKAASATLANAGDLADVAAIMGFSATPNQPTKGEIEAAISVHALTGAVPTQAEFVAAGHLIGKLRNLGGALIGAANMTQDQLEAAVHMSTFTFTSAAGVVTPLVLNQHYLNAALSLVGKTDAAGTAITAANFLSADFDAARAINNLIQTAGRAVGGADFTQARLDATRALGVAGVSGFNLTLNQIDLYAGAAAGPVRPAIVGGFAGAAFTQGDIAAALTTFQAQGTNNASDLMIALWIDPQDAAALAAYGTPTTPATTDTFTAAQATYATAIAGIARKPTRAALAACRTALAADIVGGLVF